MNEVPTLEAVIIINLIVGDRMRVLPYGKETTFASCRDLCLIRGEDRGYTLSEDNWLHSLDPCLDEI